MPALLLPSTVIVPVLPIRILPVNAPLVRMPNRLLPVANGAVEIAVIVCIRGRECLVHRDLAADRDDRS